MKVRSVGRALKRGKLRIAYKRVPTGFTASHITGQIEQKFEDIPFLVRKSKKTSRWIAYN